MHMHRAMSSSFGCSVLKRPRCKNKFSSISISNIHYCWMNSTCSNSSSISKTLQTLLKNIQIHSCSPQTCWKTSCSSRKHANAVWQKKNEVWFVVVDKHHAHPGKINSSTNVHTHLQMRSMQQVNFQTHQMFTSTNFILHILFAFTCKVQTWPKTYRSQMLIHHSAANLQLCTNKPFPAPKGIHKRKRSTCSP